MHELARLALQQAVEPGRGDLEGLGELAHLHQRRAHASTALLSSTRQQIAETLSDADADSLSAAQTAYVNGDYAKAIQLAKCASKDSPIRAQRIIGSAACSLGDAEQATEAYRRLDVPGRQYVTYVCQRSGLVTDDE